MTSSNINPIYFLDFAVPIIVNLFLVLYYRNKKMLPISILAITFLAYFGAIAIKVVFQTFTVGYIIGEFGYVSPESSLYYGLQTSILEVGIAFLLARYGVRKKYFTISNATSYGVSLSFWENGILLGVLSGISLISDFLIIAFAPHNVSTVVYNAIKSQQPSLLYGAKEAFGLVMLSILERFSSLFAHVAWGILVVMSVTLKKRKYLYIALPMGLIDALVPYSSVMGIVLFELIIFALSLLFMLLALILLREEMKPLSTMDSSNSKGTGRD